jgi:hypothetical protein
MGTRGDTPTAGWIWQFQASAIDRGIHRILAFSGRDRSPLTYVELGFRISAGPPLDGAEIYLRVVGWPVCSCGVPLVFALDDEPVHESRPSANECDPGCIDAAPARLGRRQQFVSHCQGGGPTASALSGTFRNVGVIAGSTTYISFAAISLKCPLCRQPACRALLHVPTASNTRSSASASTPRQQRHAQTPPITQVGSSPANFRTS